MATAISANSGEMMTNPSAEQARSKPRFTAREERPSPGLRALSTARPPTSSSSTEEPTTSSSLGRIETFTPTELALASASKATSEPAPAPITKIRAP